MLSKRDVQLVRLAIRWKWFTPEQGEDVLFLKRKFGPKLTVEEIIRRRAYLDDAEIEQLGEAASQSLGRQRPATTRHRPAPRAESVMAPSLMMNTTDSAAAPIPSTSSSRPSARARPRGAVMPSDRLPTRMEVPTDDETDPHRKPAWAQERETEWMARAAPRDTLYEPPIQDSNRDAGRADISEDFDEDRAKTVITSIEEILAKSKKKPANPFSDERTAVADPAQIERLRARLIERPEQEQDPAKIPGFALDVETLAELEPPLVVRAPTPEPKRDVMPPAARARAWTQQVPIRPQDLIEDQTTSAGDEENEVLEGAIGPYAIVRLIARGSRGALYRARALDGTDVAVKVISADVARRAGFIERTRLEAMRAANIESPHVVRILDVGLVGARLYVAMQYVDAWTLEERLDSGDRPDLAESLTITRDIARALAAAEQHRVLHRDVGPSNILVGRAGEAHLTGFALEKEPPTFPAPEGPLDQRSDLFALGATLYSLVAGHRPLGASLRVKADVPSLPEQVSSVIDRLLDRAPEQRYQHAADLVVDLEAAIAAVRAVGMRSAVPATVLPERAIALRAGVASGLGAGVAILLSLLARAVGLVGGPASHAAVNGALAGALASIVALLLLSALGLVRRGELPLPASSAWLVRVQDGAGALGAMLLVAGVALAPMAILNVVVAAAGVALLGSWIYGMLLRRSIALRRPDRGVGRMLAVLGDPGLARWRVVHVPMLATLAMLATARFAFLAYFAAT